MENIQSAETSKPDCLKLLGLKINKDGNPEKITQLGTTLNTRYNLAPVFDLCTDLHSRSPAFQARLKELLGIEDPSIYFPN